MRGLQALPVHRGDPLTDPDTIAARCAAVEARIAAACARAGRGRSDVLLVGASKQQPIAALAEAYAAGVRTFGENRVQEGLAKAPSLPADVEWHLLGPLQSNKVRGAIGRFRFFHAVDRSRIAQALDAEAARAGLSLAGLVEVNLGGEESKHGFSPDGLVAALRPLAELRHLRIDGLMAIPPPGESPEASRPWFRRLRELRDELLAQAEWSGSRGHLSMGMSDDFEVAIEEGATLVRVGTALFGPRRATLSDP
ncbi:MAG: YggS family pyridoxal phosphate-dependent enzyme [Thermoanaerobaculia bacterium]